MKEGVVLIPMELTGQNVQAALLRTFGREWKVSVYTVTNQLVADYDEEYGEEFLEDYREAVENIVEKHLHRDCVFFVVCGGSSFLNVILVQKLLELVDPTRVVLLVYRKYKRMYGAFTVEGRWYEVAKPESEEAVVPASSDN
jgi:hypothetical protein